MRFRHGGRRDSAPRVVGPVRRDGGRDAYEPVVVSEAFVRRCFPNEDPIGRRFCIDPANKTYWFEIVGVAGDNAPVGARSRNDSRVRVMAQS